MKAMRQQIAVTAPPTPVLIYGGKAAPARNSLPAALHVEPSQQGLSWEVKLRGDSRGADRVRAFRPHKAVLLARRRQDQANFKWRDGGTLFSMKSVI